MQNKLCYPLKCLIAEVERQGENNLNTIGRFTLTEESKEVALLLYKLVMKTEFTRQDTKQYFINRKATYRNFKKDNKCAANRNTSISRIRYDMKKIRGILGLDNIDSLYDGSIADMEEYKQRLMKMIGKYEYQSIFGDFWIKPVVNIEDVKPVESLSETELQDLETLIKYGTKEGKKFLEGLMSERIVGYIKYLQGKA